MELYEKVVSKGGKVSYVTYVAPTRAEFELDNQQLATLAATIGLCTLMGMEAHLLPHALLKRKIKAVEATIVDLVRTGGGGFIEERIKDAGTQAWGAAVHKLAEIFSQNKGGQP